MTAEVLVYGAYGYTGELIARAAVDRDVPITVAGRDRAKVEALSDQLQCEERVFAVEEHKVAEQVADEHAVVLNCAGPFEDTYQPLVEACLAAETPYLDITGEITVLEGVRRYDERASEAGVTVVPGVGFDVVPTDCLGAHVADRLPDATTLDLAFDADTGPSAGTLRTALRHIDRGGAVRRDGAIERVPLGADVREIDFGEGPRTAVAIPWGDVATAYHTTGIPDVTVYAAMPPKAARLLRATRYLSPILGLGPVQRLILRLATDEHGGPSAEERKAASTRVWAAATAPDGEQAISRLTTPGTYALTVETALAAAQTVADGEAPAGVQTPASAFGPDFVLEIDGVEREDVQ